MSNVAPMNNLHILESMGMRSFRFFSTHTHITYVHAFRSTYIHTRIICLVNAKGGNTLSGDLLLSTSFRCVV